MTGATPIDIGGRALTLVYDFDAMLALYGVTEDFKFLVGVAQKGGLTSLLAAHVDKLPAVIMAGLKREHPDVTEAEVRAGIMPLKGRFHAVADAIWAGLVDPDPEPAIPADPQVAATTGGPATS